MSGAICGKKKMCRPLPWLRNVKRRTLKDKGKRQTPEYIYDLVTGKSWPYKMDIEFYRVRDKAFLSLLYLCCGRISEVLRLSKLQFEDSEDFLLINDYRVSKTGLYRDEWPLPKRGKLSKFTNLVINHLNEPLGKIFPFGRSRGYQICRYITGLWPHWFRAQGEAFYARIVKDPYVLAVGLKLKDPKTIMEYVPFEWTDYREALLK